MYNQLVRSQQPGLATGILTWKDSMDLSVCIQLLRNTGNNIGVQLVCEIIEGGLIGLSPLPVESDLSR